MTKVSTKAIRYVTNENKVSDNKKLDKTSNHIANSEKQAKYKDKEVIGFYRESHTWLKKPINQVYLTSLAQKLVAWADEPSHIVVSASGKEEVIKHIRLKDFCTQERIPYKLLSTWAKKCENLQIAHDYAMNILGGRRERNVSDGTWPVGINNVILPLYDDWFAQGYKFHAALKAAAESSNDETKKKLQDFIAAALMGEYGPQMQKVVANESRDKAETESVPAKKLPETTP